MDLPLQDTQPHDFLSWPNDARYELIDEVSYLTPPVPDEVASL